MDIFISNSTSIKQVDIPPSKSYAQRAILAAALSKNTSTLKHIGTSKDVLAILHVAENLGAKVSTKGNIIQITGYSNPVNFNLNVGESGLGMRLTTSIAAVLEGNFKITGEGSLKNRTMDEFSHILPQLSVQYAPHAENEYYEIVGNAQPAEITIDGRISSQYLSGLLMALPILKADSKINVLDLNSKPYIDITLNVMKDFGVHVKNDSFNLFSIEGNQTYKREHDYEIEGDYSGASIWMVYGALTKGIQINGIAKDSVQGDKKMLNALNAAKVNYAWINNTLHIEKSKITPFEFDATECPDLFPALVVLAAGAIGKTVLKGANRLIHKESNRAFVLKKEFGKLGLTIILKDDDMEIDGLGYLLGGTIHSHNDHRIAMAGAIAACLTENGVKIEEAESVNKSYPEFWDAFKIHE